MIFKIRKCPALNNLYGHNRFGSTYLKSAGKVWKEECIYMIRSSGVERIEGEAKLWVKLKTCRKQDLDGILKILFDAIQASEVIDNDAQIFELNMIKEKVNIQDEGIEFEINKKQSVISN